jgi:hypothetical protein
MEIVSLPTTSIGWAIIFATYNPKGAMTISLSFLELTFISIPTLESMYAPP